MTLARALLLLYPRRLRRAHGDEMELFLEDRLARARRGRAAGSAAARTADVVARTVWDALCVWVGGAGSAATGRSAGGREERDLTTGRWTMGGWIQDSVYVMRRLGRTPLFTLGGVAIVAMAIGATTATFALVHAALFEPPPYDDPDRVVHVYQDSDEGDPSSTSYPAFLDMSATTDVFSSVGATSPDRLNLTVGEATQAVSTEYATSGLFPALGLTPSRGRWFDTSMDLVGAGYYAVVSYPTWQRRFGGDPSIVGRVVELNRQPVEIIGVGPQDFNGVFGFVITDFWLSISSTPLSGGYRVANLERRQDHWYDVRARLAEGVTLERAQEAMDGLALRLAEEYPELNRGRDITVFRARDVRVHPSEDAGLRALGGALMGVVGLVLLLAATNLGSLLLVRGFTRRAEIAVRRALGAAEERVTRLFLMEGMFLSLAGGVLGLGLAAWLVSLMSRLPLPTPGSGVLQVNLDGRVLLFALGVMALTGLFFGAAPALQSRRTDVAGALREDATVTGRRSRFVFRDGMVAVQVAVSVVLVVGASALVRGMVRLQSVDTGVDADRIALLQTTFSEAGIDGDARAPVLDELTARLGALPGVTAVEMTTRLPVSGGGSTTTVVEGYAPQTGTDAVELPFALVTPGYFEAVGMSVLAGRGYGPDDRIGPRRGVVVNETAALRFWGEAGSAVGGRLRPQGSPDAWIPVLGVVSDVTIGGLGSLPGPMIYYAMPEQGTDAPIVVARIDGDPSALLAGMRATLREVNPRLAVDRLDTFEGHLSGALAGPRLATRVLGIFSMLALLLASVGIYTIVSLTVAGRRSEIGLRMALGAARGRVVRLVTARVLGTVLIGMVVGGALAALAAPHVAGAAFGAELGDPMALALATTVLAVAVALASYLPARRAVRVDPVEALKGP